MNDVPTVTVTLDWLTETDGAIRVEDADGDRFWLPKSQIEFIRNPKKGSVDVTLEAWLARKMA